MGELDRLINKIIAMETFAADQEWRKRGVFLADDTWSALRGAEFGNLDHGHPLHGKAEGSVVISVDPGSPAARNGLRPGDVIVAVNREPVRDAAQFRRAIENSGSVIALNILRGTTQLFLVIR